MSETKYVNTVKFCAVSITYCVKLFSLEFRVHLGMEYKFYFCVNFVITITSYFIKTVLGQREKNINFMVLPTKLIKDLVNLTLHVSEPLTKKYIFSQIDLILDIISSPTVCFTLLSS